MRLKILEILLQHSDKNHALEQQEIVWYFMQKFGKITRQTVGKHLSDLLEMNELLKKLFYVELKYYGTGDKKQYYTDPLIEIEEFSKIAMAIQDEPTSTVKDSTRMVEYIKSHLNEEQLKEFDNVFDEKPVSKYSSKFEQILLQLNEAIKLKYEVNISYLNLENIDKTSEVKGYVVQSLKLFKTQYFKILDQDRMKYVFISLFDINFVSFPVKQDLYGRKRYIKNFNEVERIFNYEYRTQEEEEKIVFCVAKPIEDLTGNIAVKFKEEFYIKLNPKEVRESKYIILETNTITKEKQVILFDDKTTAFNYYNDNKLKQNKKLEGIKEKFCYTVSGIPVDAFMKFALDPMLAPYITVLSPKTLVVKMKAYVDELKNTFDTYYDSLK